MSKKTGTDFSNYKLSSLYRSISKRLSQFKIGIAKQYLDYVGKNPENWRNKDLVVLGFIAGFLVMMILGVALG